MYYSIPCIYTLPSIFSGQCDRDQLLVVGHSWWWVLGRNRALSLVQSKELLKVGLELPFQVSEVLLALPAHDGSRRGSPVGELICVMSSGPRQ
jgi:hypothetical protein